MHDWFLYPRDTTQSVLSGTDTFRTGHRKLFSNKRDTPYNNFGGNRANIAKDMRRIWNADKGMLLCQVDQSGAEALIVAMLCRAAKYRSLFLNGIKPHTYLALKLFKEQWKLYFDPAKVELACAVSIPELAKLPFWKELSNLIKSSDDWEPAKRYYHFAKKTIHAGSYGMAAARFRLDLLKESGGLINLTYKEAEAFLMAFHKEFPEIREWHQRTFVEAKRTGVLRNLLGFPYNITDFIDANDCRDLIAWVPQSTVACITKQAIVKLYKYIKEHKLNWHLLMSDCHDSYLAEANGELVDTGKTNKDLIIHEVRGDIINLGIKMKEFIEIELVSSFDGTKFRMKSEASVGFNWGPQKIDNQLGLRAL